LRIDIIDNKIPFILIQFDFFSFVFILEGQQILDGPLMLNEICNWAKRSKNRTFLFKVDFEKAFDSLSWCFLESVLAQMNFGGKWRNWIRGCLQSARASVLVNGAPTKEFALKKGVRQGDSLSPFLFILTMEGLHIAMCEVSLKGHFQGVSLPNNSPIISHFLFADDVIFLGKWTTSNVINLTRLLRCFHLASGLNVNFTKSKVFGLGVHEDEVQHLSAFLKCSCAKLPFTYLGLTVGANMGLAKHWKPVIEKVSGKLSKWKTKNLSFGGELRYAKLCWGVFHSIFSLFLRPHQMSLMQLKRLEENSYGGKPKQVNLKFIGLIGKR